MCIRDSACARAGYESGAKTVVVRWEDDKLTRLQMEMAAESDLCAMKPLSLIHILLAKHVGKKLLKERDIDKLFPEAAKLWKSAHSDAESIRASVRRGKTLLELLLLALILLAGGFAANYFDAAQTAFVILVTGVVLLALCLGGGIAAFATAAVLLVLNTVYPLSLIHI